jgi:hypothetical protein
MKSHSIEVCYAGGAQKLLCGKRCSNGHNIHAGAPSGEDTGGAILHYNTALGADPKLTCRPEIALRIGLPLLTSSPEINTSGRGSPAHPMRKVANALLAEVTTAHWCGFSLLSRR